MFSWLGRQAGGRERAGGADAVQTVTGGLRSLYLRKVLPLEEAYRFHEFHSPALEDADFENKPMILLVGQYSTGKTTFIRYAAAPRPAPARHRLPRVCAAGCGLPPVPLPAGVTSGTPP
ncbi:EH domain-containing protein 4 [Saguinus oedipus]|uniref:EH domain-containing protein 4 n=1 Tax=Saguinus oedipus TaxID=9490 RepID=A0ABQ9V2Z7_SAGOE|nr:EH domain-containing protein 4 [Saguinus oedipus]